MSELVSYRRRQPVIQLSALIDVLFIVLVFVVVAARFDRPRGVEVELPRAQGQTRGAEDAAVLVVPHAGPMHLDDATVTETGLAEALRQARAHKTALRLVADGALSLDRATRLLDAAAQAGFSSVSIATQTPDTLAPPNHDIGHERGSGVRPASEP